MSTTQTCSWFPETYLPGPLDLLNIDALLSDRKLEVLGDVRSFGKDEIKPSIW